MQTRGRFPDRHYLKPPTERLDAAIVCAMDVTGSNSADKPMTANGKVNQERRAPQTSRQDNRIVKHGNCYRKTAKGAATKKSHKAARSANWSAAAAAENGAADSTGGQA
jgi:hypothetical protein